MPTIPSEQDLYDEMQATVEGDGSTNLVDFSAGSVLDVMTGAVATAARSIMRWVQRLVGLAFVSTSSGSDLDFVIADRVDSLPRLSGESDDDYKTRYFEYIRDALGRGTLPAWRYFLTHAVEGVDPLTFTIVEDLDLGTVTLTIRPLPTYSEATIKATADSLKGDWRVFGGPFPNVVTLP